MLFFFNLVRKNKEEKKHKLFLLLQTVRDLQRGKVNMNYFDYQDIVYSHRDNLDRNRCRHNSNNIFTFYPLTDINSTRFVFIIKKLTLV